MAEHRRLRLGTAIAVGPGLLVPIERVVLRFAGTGGHGWFTASNVPCAVIFCSGCAAQVLWVDGAQAVSLAALRELVPGLDTHLARVASAAAQGPCG